jgi:hypothetical protein
VGQPDPNFMGIDPSLVGQLMRSMTSGVSGAEPVARSYLGQFSRLGLDSGALSKLLADYAWATSQQPMLQRRYSLSSHLPSGDFAGGMTTIGAGALTYATTAAAKSAGTAEARQLQAALDARNWAGIQQALLAMKANGDDADYMSALFTQLGPSGLWQLSLYAQGGRDKGQEQEVRQVIGTGLATASFEMNLTRSFLQGMKSGDPFGYPPELQPGGWDTSVLAPFLTEGEFSSQWLGVIAPATLYLKGIEAGEQVPPGYDAIFRAIAANPGFAAGFFKQNSGQLADYMTDPELNHYLASDVGFGQFLEAATIAPRGASSTGPFTANAATFVRLFGSGADTTDTVRLAMAAATVYYFNDLRAAVTGAAPGAASPMGLSTADWAQFVQQSMKDKTSAAFLLASYATWEQSQPVDNRPFVVDPGNPSVRLPMKGDGPLTPSEAGFWNDFSGGLLDYFFAANYQAAGQTAGKGDENTVLALLKDAGTAGAATLITSLAFGPEAGIVAFSAEALKDAGTEAGQDAFSTAVEGTISGLTGKIGEGGDGPAELLDSNLTSVQKLWANKVLQDFQAGGGRPGAPAVTPVWFENKPYSGDPAPYQARYGANFMDGNGNLLYGTPEEWQQHPQALAAYNAWLQDPAISAMTGDLFGVRTEGSLAGLYQTLENSGG